MFDNILEGGNIATLYYFRAVMIRTLLTPLLLFTANITSAQWVDSIKQYLDIEYQEIDIKTQGRKYAYYREAYQAENGYWFVTTYYSNTDIIASEGTYLEYSDGSFQIKEGRHVDYHVNGKIEKVSKFLRDISVGLYREYYITGIPRDSTYYDLNGMPYGRFYQWDSDSSLLLYGELDSNGTGAGHVIAYYENGSVKYTGQYMTGYLSDSIWTYYYEDGSLLGIDVYDAGELLNFETYDRTGAKISCKGGLIMPAPDYNVDRYLSKRVHYPTSAKFKGERGVVEVAFVVSEEGVLGDFFISKTSGYESLDHEALRLVQRMPKWNPGLQRCRPIKVWYTIPITFWLE